MLNSFRKTDDFLNRYFYIIKYFTFWIAILLLFYNYTSHIFNLYFLTLLTVIGGFYISFCNPKYYSFQFSSYTLKVDTVFERCIIEFCVHLMLFVFVILNNDKNYSIFSYQTVNSLLFIIIYLLIVDAKNMYHIESIDIATIVLIFVPIYITIHFSLKAI